MGSIKVTVNVPGLTNGAAAVGGMSRTPPPPPIARMFDQWGHRYETFIRRRFDRYSKGGGDWAPLALSTGNARRAPARRSAASPLRTGAASSLFRDTARGGALVGTGRRASILVNTGILKAALTIGARGNQFKQIPGGVRYGFGPEKHPAGKKALSAESIRGLTSRRAKLKNLPNIDQLAAFHQYGGKHLPARPILVPPDAATLRGMQNDGARAMKAIFEGRPS